MTQIPGAVEDDEVLHRRIHPNHVKDDGTLTSAAFNNTSGTRDMSVDRAQYWSIEESLTG